MTTIFTRILSGEIPSEKVYEDDLMIAIHDIHPAAPVHLLIIPKKEYRDLQSVPPDELVIVAEVAKVAQKLARQFNVDQGYRFLTNNGSSAGQTVFHLHFHLLGGTSLGELG